MAEINKLVRANVKSLIPYSCARDEFKGKDGIFLDANENPYGNLNRYPDPYQNELKTAISQIKEVPEGIFCGGMGCEEIMAVVFGI